MMLSHEIGRSSYKEMYAFLWREDRVDWLDGAAVYIDDRDAFAREPMSARFETEDGVRFVMTSIHIIYGDTVEERQVEVAALAGYRDWLKASFPEDPVILAGDFNLPPADPAWAAVGTRAWPLIQGRATTLGEEDGRFVSAYDNLWVEAGTPLPLTAAGVVDFPALLGMSHAEARDRVSDHAPVWLSLDATAAPQTLNS